MQLGLCCTVVKPQHRETVLRFAPLVRRRAWVKHQHTAASLHQRLVAVTEADHVDLIAEGAVGPARDVLAVRTFMPVNEADAHAADRHDLLIAPAADDPRIVAVSGDRDDGRDELEQRNRMRARVIPAVQNLRYPRVPEPLNKAPRQG